MIPALKVPYPVRQMKFTYQVHASSPTLSQQDYVFNNTHDTMNMCPLSVVPEGDGFEGPLGHGLGLLDLGGFQVVGHVPDPHQGAVGGLQDQPVKVLCPLRHHLPLQLLLLKLQQRKKYCNFIKGF